jgi:glycosyltransferase involved in cell wall biosynthesis
MLPLARYLRRERPHAMLSALNHANIVSILARKIARVPIRLVVSERNSLVSLGGGSRGHLLRTLMRWCYPMADLVVSVSRDGARELVTELWLPDRLVTAIPNPVSVDEIIARAAVAPHHPWLVPGSPPVVLAVGRLEAQKDYPTLLRAFALLRRNYDLRLIILGEGSLRHTLEGQIQELGLTTAALPLPAKLFARWLLRPVCDVIAL